MNNLKLLALGMLTGFAVTIPVQAQTESSMQLDTQLEEPADISRAVEQLPPSLAAPLEVGRQQSDEFFAPSPRELPSNNPTGTVAVQERLIQPPPGTYMPGQLIPEQRLSIPIQ